MAITRIQPASSSTGANTPVKNDRPNTTSVTRLVVDAESDRMASAVLSSATPSPSASISRSIPATPDQLAGR